MKEKIIENGIEYVRNGDYYIPNLKVYTLMKLFISSFSVLEPVILRTRH